MELIKFAEKYKRAVNPQTHKLTHYPLHAFEKDVLESFENDDYALHLRSRQMHFNTLVATYIAWFLLENSDRHKTILVMAPKLETAASIVRKVKDIIQGAFKDDYVGWWLREDKLRELVTGAGNRVKAVSASGDACCGEGDIHTTFFIDAAFIKDLKELLPVFNRSSRCLIMESAPKSPSTFQQIWEIKGQNNWVRKQWHYSVNPCWTPERLNEYRSVIGGDWDKEMEMKFTDDNKVVKNKIVPVRLDDILMNQVGQRLIELDVNISDYIRGLIEKDVKSQS